MSKILKLTEKLLDDTISRLEKEINELTTELDAHKRARNALASPTNARKVEGRYRTTPTVKLRGKTQKKVYALISNRGPMRAAELSGLLHISQKAASMCLYGMKSQGILKVTERGRYGLK
jgi:hypothetical protein